MKTAFITGASRGIGAGIALALAKEGYALALMCEKNTEKLFEVKSQINKISDMPVSCFSGDVSNYELISDIKDRIYAKYDHLDVLINNAGISRIGLLTDCTPEEWNNIINVNLTSIYNTCHAFVPDMVRKKSGHIINISSVWGERGASCEVAYSASKGGVNAFTKALAKELAPSNIMVNAIACGVIDTDMNACFSEEERSALEEEIPVGRMGTPEEVGACVANLLKTPYLTGQLIGLDGGF